MYIANSCTVLSISCLRNDTSDDAGVTLLPIQLYAWWIKPRVTDWCIRLASRSPDVHTVVRYNQRGTGRSAGSKSIWGSLDMADAKAVCQHVLSLPSAPTHLHVVGYACS